MARPAHHYHPLVRHVARALRQRCGVRPGASVVVACSGGADSVALLRSLALLAPRRQWRLGLTVAHVQHHLRDEAEADARFVEALAGELGLPFARRDIHPGQGRGNVEANAREQRYAALAEIAEESGASFVVTAHHADDQLETLLMRLLRGTSVAGLRGIAWVKPVQFKNGDQYLLQDAEDAVKGTDPLFLIRPMLAAGQADVQGFLDQLGQPWREDATNADTSRTRAGLRHEVLPLLKALQPDAANKANELAEHFGDIYALVQSAAREAAEHRLDAKADETSKADQAGSSVVLTRSQARTMNRAVLAEVLRSALIEAEAPADRLSRHALLPAVRAAQDTAGGSRSFGFSNGVTLVITREAVALQRA